MSLHASFLSLGEHVGAQVMYDLLLQSQDSKFSINVYWMS